MPMTLPGLAGSFHFRGRTSRRPSQKSNVVVTFRGRKIRRRPEAANCFPRLLASAVMGCVLLGFVRESRKTEPYAVAQLIRSKIRSTGRSPYRNSVVP